MSEQQSGMAVGVFDDRTHAERAVDELLRMGFTTEQIGFVVPDGTTQIEKPDLPTESKVGEGAGVGVATGLALGGLLGAAAPIMLPGIGSALALGALVGAIGAAGGGIFGALMGMSVPEDHAKHCERQFHLGRTLVTVQAGDRYNEVMDLMKRIPEEPEHHPHYGKLGLSDDDDNSGSVGNNIIPRP
jgi:hypothetical protein